MVCILERKISHGLFIGVSLSASRALLSLRFSSILDDTLFRSFMLQLRTVKPLQSRSTGAGSLP